MDQKDYGEGEVMGADIALRLRAGAELLLQCPEYVRISRGHAPMDANLHRRADEANEAADEIERLRADRQQLCRAASATRADLETARNVYKCNSGIGPRVK